METQHHKPQEYVKMPLKSAGINTKTSPVYSARHAISLGSFMK